MSVSNDDSYEGNGKNGHAGSLVWDCVGSGQGQDTGW